MLFKLSSIIRLINPSTCCTSNKILSALLRMEDGYFAGYSELCQFQEDQQINNVEYSTNGEFLSYTTGGLLKVYETKRHSVRNIISMDIEHSKFFQRHTMIQSFKNLLFHHSIYDNKLLQRFDHGGNVDQLSTNPFYDTFMSVGSAKVNLWDIRMEKPIKYLNAPGYIGALSSDNRYCLCLNGQIKMFDMREDHGPLFTTLAPPAFYDTIWFTRDSNMIIVATKNAYTCVTSSGETREVITLENPGSGDTSPESDVLVCSAKKYLMAYRLDDRTQRGIFAINYDLCSSVRMNPTLPQILCTSGSSMRLYSQHRM